jgi:adenylylsulfate reductase subunit A
MTWYCPYTQGAGYAMGIRAGAEMTCQEVRFVPIRFKDACGPVGAWFLLFKCGVTNGEGEAPLQTRRERLDAWARYGTGRSIPASLRTYLMRLDVMEGRGPLLMRTSEALMKIASNAGAQKTAGKLKELEAEAWGDFLDMTIPQAALWAATNIRPELEDSEIVAAEPCFVGSHAGASGAWVSGPQDLAPAEYFWGHANMRPVVPRTSSHPVLMPRGGSAASRRSGTS